MTAVKREQARTKRSLSNGSQSVGKCEYVFRKGKCGFSSESSSPFVHTFRVCHHLISARMRRRHLKRRSRLAIDVAWRVGVHNRESWNDISIGHGIVQAAMEVVRDERQDVSDFYVDNFAAWMLFSR